MKPLLFPFFQVAPTVLKVFVDILVKCCKVALLHHALSRLYVQNVSKVANDFAFIELIPFVDIGFVEHCWEQRS